MSVLESRVDARSDVARENRAHMEQLVAELRDQLAVARLGESLGFDAFFRSDHYQRTSDILTLEHSQRNAIRITEKSFASNYGPLPRQAGMQLRLSQSK